MAVVGTRCRRALGMWKGGRRSPNSKNRALIRGSGDMVDGEGGGNLTLIYLVSGESQRGSEV